jgi:hypothetical protein
MLNHLRRRVIDLLEPTQAVTLSSCGPAGIQAQVLPGVAKGLRLYVLVPTTSEHLFNLEQQPIVVATTADWQLRGYAHRLSPSEIPTDIPTLRDVPASNYVVIEVKPYRFEVGPPNGSGFSETIDLDQELESNRDHSG